MALPVSKGGEGVPVPQADPENEGVSVPEALVVTQRVPLACWEAASAAIVGVPVPEAHWLGVIEAEALREDWPEAESEPLLQGLGVNPALSLVLTVPLGVMLVMPDEVTVWQ